MDKSHDKQPGVDGRLRQRLAQMLLNTSCTAATTSATAFVGHASTTNATAPTSHQQPAPAPAPPRARPRGSHVHEPRSSFRAVIGDGSSSSCQRRRGHHHHRRRDARALVHISIDCSSARSSLAAAAAVLQHSAPVAMRSKGKGGGSRKSGLPRRSPSYGYGWNWSSSSASDTDDEAAPFSSEAEWEGAVTARSSTLFSSHSRSFSNNSASELYSATNIHGGGTRPRRRKKKPSPPPRRAPSRSRPPADADAFRPSAGEHRGKKEEQERRSGDGSRCRCGSAVAAAGSTAVVKRSRNPYADFRSSMAEMVAGRRIRGADALSEVLVWYLSLNSPRHHPAILAAFEDVWEAVLGTGEP